MSVLKPMRVVAEDLAITKPLPTVSIPNKNKFAHIGPRDNGSCVWTEAMLGPDRCYNKGTSCGSARDYLITNFSTPVYMPDPMKVPLGFYYDQSSVRHRCASDTILLRHEYEGVPLTNGKAYGGFDKYSVRDIPSCADRSGTFANIMDFSMDPFSRIIVSEQAEMPVIWNGHNA